MKFILPKLSDGAYDASNKYGTMDIIITKDIKNEYAGSSDPSNLTALTTPGILTRNSLGFERVWVDSNYDEENSEIVSNKDKVLKAVTSLVQEADEGTSQLSAYKNFINENIKRVNNKLSNSEQWSLYFIKPGVYKLTSESQSKVIDQQVVAKLISEDNKEATKAKFNNAEFFLVVTNKGTFIDTLLAPQINQDPRKVIDYAVTGCTYEDETIKARKFFSVPVKTQFTKYAGQADIGAAIMPHLCCPLISTLGFKASDFEQYRFRSGLIIGSNIVRTQSSGQSFPCKPQLTIIDQFNNWLSAQGVSQQKVISDDAASALTLYELIGSTFENYIVGDVTLAQASIETIVAYNASGYNPTFWKSLDNDKFIITLNSDGENAKIRIIIGDREPIDFSKPCSVKFSGTSGLAYLYVSKFISEVRENLSVAYSYGRDQASGSLLSGTSLIPYSNIMYEQSYMMFLNNEVENIIL